MFIMLAQGTFLGRGEIGRFSFVETLPRVLLAVLVVALVLLQWVTLENSLWLYSISFALIAPVSLIFVLRGVSGFRARLDALPRMAGYGLAFALNLSMVLLNVRIGVFLLERLSGAEAAGLYFAATRVNEIFLEAATAFGLVIFSRAVRTDEAGDIVRRNARIACWIFWCFLLGGLAVAALAPFLVGLVLGGGYAGAVPLLQIAALALGPSAAVKIIYPSIAGQGKPWLGTVILALTLGLNMLAAWALIGGMGAAGAALALVIAQYAALAMYAVLLKFKFGVRMRVLFIPSRSDAANLAAVLKRLRFSKDRKGN
jgi:O-antigen/teichoic acid export membrane protein